MKLTDAEYIEKILEESIYTTTGLRLQPNQWLIDEIEKLLNCYPLLRKFNYKVMGLSGLQALIQSLSESLEMKYSEDDDLLFVDLTEMKTLFSLKEMILWMIIASLNNKSHVHYKLDEQLLNEMKVSEFKAIDHLCDNSYFIANSTKKECHFTLSIAAVLSFDYKNQDSIINSIKSIQNKRKKGLSVIEYINYRKVGQNINNKPKLKKRTKSIKIKI